MLFFGSSKMKTTMDGKDLEETFQLLEEENKVFGQSVVLCILYQLSQVVRRRALETLLKRFQDVEEIFEQVDDNKFKTAGLRSLDDK